MSQTFPFISLCMILLFCFKQKCPAQRHRVFILTDISSLKSGVGEPDDAQSLIRFLFYANEFDIEGFGATYTSHNNTIYPQYIEKVLFAYEQLFPKLKQHGNYPEPQTLVKKIKRGNPHKGTEQIGEGKDTELSEYIITALKKNTNQPLWVLAWGGSLDLAQALWKIRATMPSQEATNLVGKLRVYAIADQYDKCGEWIRNNFKDLFYILNNGSFRGMYRNGDTSLSSSEWVNTNILLNAGSLAKIYPNYDGGDPWGNVKGIKEGDTPSFLYLLPQSPGTPENPETESWGGKFKKIVDTNHYTDCAPKDALSCADNVARWRADFQLDFVKRLSWGK